MNKTSTSQTNSPALQLMAVDIFCEMLAVVAPSRLGAKITEQMRELTGAQIALLITHNQASGSHALVNADPVRRKELFSIEQLALLCPGNPLEVLPYQVAQYPASHPLRSLLTGAGIDSLIRFPLITGGELFGMLVLMNFPEMDRIEEVAAVVTLLSPVIALTLKNALNQEQLEKQATILDLHAKELERRVAERTVELQNMNTALRESEARVLHLNAVLEQRVAERTAELTFANQELETFAYAVAHDLRAPLRTLIGYSDALGEDFGTVLKEVGRDYLNHITGASRHMGELIEAILTLSRYSHTPLTCVWIDLAALSEGILAELAHREPARQVKWVVEPGLGGWGDAQLVSIIFQNLLGNAWKYTAKTDGAVIRVFSETEAGVRYICVTDNGVGFDMNHCNRLFKPFQRLHRQEEYPGIGIGLATVQRIVRRHGGVIRAISVPGSGAKFSFTLPVPDIQ